MPKEVQGLADAAKLRDMYQSARARALESLESYVTGTQYAGLPDWFSDEKPLWERAPCVVYPIVSIAIDSNANLLLGEGRFPEFQFDGLSGEEAEKAEDAVDKLVAQSRLKASAREEFESGQGCGSSCAIFGLRGGRIQIDTVRAGWCEPKLDAEGAVTSLEIRYPYLVIEYDEQIKDERWVCRLYRRSIDATNDVTYKPAKAKEDGKEPDWVIDSEYAHGFGFCPVVWYAHMKRCAVVNDFDGRAIHEHLTDEIRGHDFACSQRHRAALYAGDPQWTEIGVEPGFNPTSKGRAAVMRPASHARPGESHLSSWESDHPSHGGKARKKTPGGVWQYPGKNPEVKVQLHTLPGDALLAIADHAKDLRSKLAEALGVVFLDLESLPNESRMSGRAFEAVKAQQLDRIDYYRADFGDKFLRPALGMLLRIAIVKNLKIEGLDLIKSEIQKAGDLWSWHAPPIEFVWGDYFKPSGEEEELLIRGATQALTAGFMTKRAVVEKLRTVLGVRDVDAFMKELEAEQAELVKQQKDMLDHEAKATAAARPKPTPVAKPKAKK